MDLRHGLAGGGEVHHELLEYRGGVHLHPGQGSQLLLGIGGVGQDARPQFLHALGTHGGQVAPGHDGPQAALGAEVLLGLLPGGVAVAVVEGPAPAVLPLLAGLADAVEIGGQLIDQGGVIVHGDEAGAAAAVLHVDA